MKEIQELEDPNRVKQDGDEASLKELKERETEYRERITVLNNEIKEINDNENHPELTKEYFIVDKIKENQNEDEIGLERRTGEFYIDAYKSAHESSVIGDTVGDPLKDTSGPSLNILIKLSCILSVVFGGVFLKTSLLSKSFNH